MAAPVIEVFPTRLEFDSVTLGDTVFANFKISNRGDSTLHISAIDVPQGTLVNPLPRFGVAPDSSIRVDVEFAPPDTSSREAVLTIHSDDPVTPTVDITWSPIIQDLEVTARAFTTGRDYPLGEALVVQCVPVERAHVEKATLFYRSRELESFQPLEMVRNDQVLIAIIPGSSVTEGGVEFYVVAENAPFSTMFPPGGPSRPIRVDVESPETFRLDPVVRNPGLGFKSGESIDFLLALQRGTVYRDGTLHFRACGDTAYQATDILEISFTGISATIPSWIVGPRGIEYWAEITTATTRITVPFDTTTPIPLRITVVNMEEPSLHVGGHYRMLSVPLEFASGTSLGPILSDDPGFGAPDPVRWRAFRYVPDELNNAELTVSTEGLPNWRVIPGRGFWLISRDAHTINTAPAVGVSTRADEVFAMEIPPGWNQIGNPFAFPIHSRRVRRSGPASALVAYDSARDDYSDHDVDELQPFEGYFIENQSTTPETLYFTPIAVDSAQSVPPDDGSGGEGAVRTAVALERGTAPMQPSASGPLAAIRLEARSAQSADRTNRIGIAADAIDGRDERDQSKPPAIPWSDVRLSIANRGWSEGAGLYRRDIRDAGASGHTWEFEVTSTAAQPVEVTLHPEGAWPEGTRMRLIDREQGSVIDLDPSAPSWRQEVLAFGAKPYRLALVIGSADYLRGEVSPVRPDRLVLDPVSPNPGRGAQRLRFGLPRDAAVTLEVFDATGRRVATLLDRAQLPAGYHSAVWQPARDGHGRVASGIYFHRLTAGGETRTMRAVMVR
jgi:hypothetical protein